MRVTIHRKRLIQMLESVRRKLPGQKKKDKTVRLYACAARVFVESNGVTAGEEGLVLADGDCRLPLETFLAVLKTYPDKENITFEADDRVIRFFSTTLPVTDYSRAANPPGKFQVFPVTDLNVLRPKPGDAT